MKKLLDQAMGAVSGSARDAASRVEGAALSTRDAVLDKVSIATGAATKLYAGVVGTVTVMIDVGIVVAAIAAPVPTAVALGLLWLLEHQMRSVSNVVDDSVEDERAGRQLKRVTGLLKKYGQIPETATLRTAGVVMNINSRSGEVSGTIVAGAYEGQSLGSLSASDLQLLIATSNDDDTRSVLEGYRALREAQGIVS